jgi:hypothetical protein
MEDVVDNLVHDESETVPAYDEDTNDYGSVGDNWGDDDWGWEGKEEVFANFKKTRHQIMKEIHEERMMIADEGRMATRQRHLVQLLACGLLFAGGVSVFVILMFNITTTEFTIASEVTFLQILFSTPVFLTLLGTILIGTAAAVFRYPTLYKGLIDIGQIQQEMAAGFGESRPLIQVVEETVKNARETFIVQLRLSQAMSWFGLLLLGGVFYRVLFMGETNWLSMSVAGGVGLLSWIFVYLIAQFGNIQRNLADVTQLEMGLVGLAKRVNAIDRWLTNFLIDPYVINESDVQVSQESAVWALEEIEKGTFAMASLVELFAQHANKKEREENPERATLLENALKTFAHIKDGRSQTGNGSG